MDNGPRVRSGRSRSAPRRYRRRPLADYFEPIQLVQCTQAIGPSGPVAAACAGSMHEKCSRVFPTGGTLGSTLYIVPKRTTTSAKEKTTFSQPATMTTSSPPQNRSRAVRAALLTSETSSRHPSARMSPTDNTHVRMKYQKPWRFSASNERCGKQRAVFDRGCVQDSGWCSAFECCHDERGLAFRVGLDVIRVLGRPRSLQRRVLVT
jgi:hypothetical protein